jgi:hypothetical protein
MNCQRRCWLTVAVLAVGTAALSAQNARAGWLGFRNELDYPVIIQVCAESKDGIRPGTPKYVYPSEVVWDRVPDSAPRRVTISDARSPRPILINRMPIAVPEKDDVLYLIQPTNRPNPQVHLLKANHASAHKGGR